MPVITLTSDIGHKDYLVGAMKGRLLQVNEDFKLVDISHDIAPFNFNEAAYFMRNAYPNFPAFTWHIILLNMFDSQLPKCLLAHHKGMYFACPDNGLLPMIFDELPDTVIELSLKGRQQFNMLDWISQIGEAIMKMENGAAFHSLGAEPETIVVKHNLKPTTGPEWIEGRIIFIDRFENVVVNITRKQFEDARNGRKFNIVFKSDDVISKISDHYGQVNEGLKLAFFNTADYLEIAVNKGNAAGLFGLQTFTPDVDEKFLKQRMFYQTVRIFFET